MPRTKPLIRDVAGERAEARNRLIKAKAYLRGYKTQKELSQALGEGGSWLSRRLNGDSCITLDDVLKMDKVLRFSVEELAQLVRGR